MTEHRKQKQINVEGLDNMNAAAMHSTITAKGKLSSRGQVVVPLEIRKAIGAEEGDQIIFKFDGQGKGTWELVKAASVDEVFGILHRPDMRPVDASDEEVHKRIYQALAKEKRSIENKGEEDE